MNKDKKNQDEEIVLDDEILDETTDVDSEFEMLNEEGEEVSSADPAAYFYGVAQNVMREHLRSPERRAASGRERRKAFT